MTLIYLTTQLRQNTRAVRVASLQALDKSVTDNIAIFATHAVLLRQGMQEPSTLSDNEQFRFHLLVSMFYLSMDSFFWSHRNRVLPIELWTREQGALKDWVNSPGGRTAWQSAHLSRRFREYVEAHLLEPALPLPLAPPPRQNSNLGDVAGDR